MDHDDPISQFFPGEEEVDLYAVLGLTEKAKAEDIKKSYRRLALAFHPDKHATADESAKKDASIKFQQIGFAYAVLSDEKRRSRYDTTGKTDEGFDMAAGEDGWEAYFEEMFDRVTRGKLDEMKKEYQGSQEEVEDLKSAYLETKGSLGDVMTHIPHSTHDDEARFVVTISELISQGELESLPAWEKSSKDEKAKLVRRKQGEKEAAEAEKLAKDLGVWDEFYGSGKVSNRKGKGKGNAKQQDDEEGDVSALQALILKKREKNMDNFFDGLAAKYGGSEPDSKSKRKDKKRANGEEDADSSPKKKSRKNVPPPPPDIDEAEFERLQQKLFGNKKASDEQPAKTERKTRGRKAK